MENAIALCERATHAVVMARNDMKRNLRIYVDISLLLFIYILI